jgi:hypothetical protein
MSRSTELSRLVSASIFLTLGVLDTTLIVVKWTGGCQGNELGYIVATEKPRRILKYWSGKRSRIG